MLCDSPASMLRDGKRPSPPRPVSRFPRAASRSNHFNFVAAFFSLMVLGFWSVHRLCGWCIGIPGDFPTSRDARPHRFQFPLRSLFLCTAVAACLLAAYRNYFPAGFPEELLLGWRREAAMLVRGLPLATLVIVPTAVVPCTVLGFRRPSSACLLSVVAAVFGWIGLDYALVELGGNVPLTVWPEIIAAQSGASAAGLISGLVLRAFGYRLFRPERHRKPQLDSTTTSAIEG